MTSGLPYFTSCADVLARVYEFIDKELDDADCARIREHLDACGPCLKEFGLEQVVKEIVHRACRDETSPEDLRAKVMGRIREVQVEIADRPPGHDPGGAPGR